MFVRSQITLYAWQKVIHAIIDVTKRQAPVLCHILQSCMRERGRDREKQRHRQTSMQACRQPGRKTNRHTQRDKKSYYFFSDEAMESINDIRDNYWFNIIMYSNKRALLFYI